MVERFGYSLDVGKSLENENSDNSEKNEESKKEKDSGKDTSSEQSRSNEPLGDPKTEDLSVDSTEKDILDDIKEDIEIKPANAEGVDEDSADELPEEDNTGVSEEDSMSSVAKTSEEAYAEESVSAEKIPPIVDEEESAQDKGVVDKKEELDEFEEPMPDKPEKEPEPEPEKPRTQEEEDVDEMVDKSFKEDKIVKETTSAQEAVVTQETTSEEATPKETKADEEAKGFGWKKWAVGIAVVLVLAVIVYKLGFVGVVDNSPTAAVPSDDEIDQELDEFFKDADIEDITANPEPEVDEEIIEDTLSEESEEPVAQEDYQTVTETPEETEQKSSVIKKVGRDEPIKFRPEPEPKDPDELLNILNQGLS
ncbi:hypothetical protein GF358_04350 [Candidatus Woesearchaeota archaeon]|nr:hypothetical protein [Candidatus Woesearchaeota archaeon]